MGRTERERTTTTSRHRRRLISTRSSLSSLRCLGSIPEVAAELVSNGDRVLVELAAKSSTTAALADWIRSLPQRDDHGDKADGPKVDECRPPQRLRLPAPDPNCVERAALYL